MSNQRIDIDTVIGTGPDQKDEIVDINSSRDVKIRKVIAFIGAGKSGNTLVRNRPASHSGLFSKRPKVTGNTDHEVGQIEKVSNELREFNKQVTVVDFPASLPQLELEVRLVAEFEDGSDRPLLNHRYRFDLSKRPIEFMQQPLSDGTSGGT